MKKKHPSLPSYRSAADYLEKKNGADWRLAGWTALRAALIGTPFVFLRVEPKKVVAGSLLASTLITTFAVIRIYSEGPRR